MNYYVILGLMIMVAAGIGYYAYARSVLRRTRQEFLARLDSLPPVAHDFTTPEGAVLCLEDACRLKDIEQAVACKSFTIEARLLLQASNKNQAPAPESIAQTAADLEKSFRQDLPSDWPDFDGAQTYFTERHPFAEQVVVVTAVCRYEDGDLAQHNLLVAETPQGWRVINRV